MSAADIAWMALAGLTPMAVWLFWLMVRKPKSTPRPARQGPIERGPRFDDGTLEEADRILKSKPKADA